MTVGDSAQEATRTAPPASPTTLVAPKWFAAFGLVTGLGAVVASSCCVVPLGLAMLGAGAGILGGLETIAAWRVPLLSVSGLGIVAGWGAWSFKRPVACVAGSSCATPERSRATLALLLFASVIVLAAASWSYIDPLLLKFLRGH